MLPLTRNAQSKLPERTEPSLSGTTTNRRRHGHKNNNFTERAGTFIQLRVTLALALLRLMCFCHAGVGKLKETTDPIPLAFRAVYVCGERALLRVLVCMSVFFFLSLALATDRDPRLKAGLGPTEPARSPPPVLIMFPHGTRRSLRFRSQAVRRSLFRLTAGLSVRKRLFHVSTSQQGRCCSALLLLMLTASEVKARKRVFG